MSFCWIEKCKASISRNLDEKGAPELRNPGTDWIFFGVEVLLTWLDQNLQQRGVTSNLLPNLKCPADVYNAVSQQNINWDNSVQ